MEYLIWSISAALLTVMAVRCYRTDHVLGINIAFVDFWWMIFILLAIPSKWNLFALSLKTTALLCGGSLMLSVGFTAFTLSRAKLSQTVLVRTLHRWNRQVKNRLERFTLDRSRVFFALQIILLGVFVYYFVRYNALLKVHGASMARMIKFQLGLLFHSTLEAMVYQYLISALFYVSMFYYVTHFFSKFRFNIGIVLIAVNTVLFSLIGQGRFVFFNLLLLILIECMNAVAENPKRLKRVVIPVCALFVVLAGFMVGVTLLRMGAGLSALGQKLDSIVFQVYMYFTGGMKALQKLIAASATEVHTFVPGQFTFNVIMDPLLSVLSKVFPSLAVEDAMVFLQNPVPISAYTETNALFTYYINFFMDFSYAGMLIIPLFLGAFLALCVYFVRKSNIAVRMFAFCNILFLVNGVLRWEYQNYEDIMALILIILCYYFTKEKEHAA